MKHFKKNIWSEFFPELISFVAGITYFVTRYICTQNTVRSAAFCAVSGVTTPI
jgi:hypothetical protein